MPRTRTSILVPFSFDTKVIAQDSRQDKIELSCLDFICLHGGEEVVAEIKSALTTEDANSEFGRMFCRPDLIRIRKPLIIRKNKPKGRVTLPTSLEPILEFITEEPSLSAPNFAGQCNFKFSKHPAELSSNDDEESTRTHIRLDLQLNPTRFLRHQEPEEIMAAEEDGTERGRLSIWKQRLGVDEEDEYSLDLGPDNRTPSDNWIPDNEFFGHYATGERWNWIVDEYLRGVFVALHRQFEDAASVNGNWFLPAKNRSYILSKVESYFEFSSLDPIKAVYDMWPLLQAFGEREVGLRHYPIRRLDDLSHYHNAPVLSLIVENGVELIVYAKTNRRIRIEVRHDLSKKNLPFKQNRRSVSRRRKLSPMLHTVQKDAARVVNSIFAFMRNRKSYPEVSASVMAFLADFARATLGLKGAEALLSMLVYNGRIVVDPNIQKAVTALRKAGIIESIPRNNRRGHDVVPRYRRALELLKKTDLSLLWIRNREPAGRLT